MSDLPPALQAAAFENVIYVVEQAHSTPEEVDKTIFHELYGQATATLIGGEWLAKQNAVLKAIGGAGLYRPTSRHQPDR
jgi:hypothetical protein